ncbi:MAG: YceI family protein [Bacteroidetes bacterium]|nr:YceI family protein [Bacteroidota bacterium]
MKILFVSFVLFVSLISSAIASTKNLSIDVALSPAGSFTITSSKIKGKVYIDNNGEISAKNIKVPVKTLKTGIELRDNHLKKKLGYEKDKKAVLLLVEAKGVNGKGKAKFRVLNKEQIVDFTYKKVSEKLGEAIFSLKLDTFGISGISYMGVGVKNTVNVKVKLPFKIKK